jgi:hypothetical protein
LVQNVSFFSKILVKFGTKIHFLSQISPCTPLHFAKIHQHGPTTFGVGRTKVGGGCKNPFFYRKNGFFAGPLQKFISTDPQHLGSAEKKSQNPFFYRKIKIYATFYRNSSARTHNIWGRTKKIRKNPFFYRKIKIYATFYRNSSDGKNAPKKATVTTILIKAVTCSFLPSNSIV